MTTASDLGARLVALVNGVHDADRLLETLDLRGEFPLAKATAEAVLEAKLARPENQFTDAGQIGEILVDPQLFDHILHSLQNAPWKTHPALLLPLRLETRFQAGRLLVRIYPDQIFVDTHEEALTEVEYTAARAYHSAEDNTKRDAWRILSSQFGPQRAAWIITWAEGHDFTASPPAFKAGSWTQAKALTSLPDRFWVFTYRDGAIIHVTQTMPVRVDNTVIASPNAVVEGLFDDRSKWMHDFSTAIDDGFAVEINLSGEDLIRGFDRVIALGLKWTSASQGAALLEGLLDAHHYTGGLGFIEPGSPTNNTEEVKSPYTSREDHDAAYGVEVEGPANWDEQSEGERRTNAHRFADALGIDPVRFRYIEGAGLVGDSYAGGMNAITWPVTGDYYLRYLLPDMFTNEQLDYIGEHVRSYVRGGGPLPAIRVGRQPYGVLPVTRVLDAQENAGGWAPWDGDGNASSALDRAIHQVVTQFYLRWLGYATNHRRIPRVGVEGTDPDETLLRILSMEPNSVTYRARPFVDERFIALLLAVLRDYAFGPGSAYENLGLTPLEWMAKWSDSWEQVQRRIASLIVALTGEVSSGVRDQLSLEILDEPLLKILAWWDGEDEPVGMVEGANEGDALPIIYLAELCKDFSTDTETLLADFGRRALSLTAEQSAESREKVHDAICQLSTTSALEFFNAVEEPEQIVQRIEDDPARDAFRDVEPPYAYGVRLNLARAILERREQLGGRFESLRDIDDVPGIGPDTMHDILYTFREAEGQPDIDRLFRESLDLASHRVDAWVTSFATKRLAGLRANDATAGGVHLGAYGFVEDLKPRTDRLSEGYLHAPSAGHAAAAAVMFNAYLTHDPAATSEAPDDVRTENPFRINLTSQRVRYAMRVLEGIRQGQPLGALLGYQFERALKDHEEPLEQYLHDFRKLFPVVAHKVTDGVEEADAVAARNVVDGVALVRDHREEDGTDGKVAQFIDSLDGHGDPLNQVVDLIDDTLDAVGDLLLNESVYQAVQGNYERAGAALEAASGNLAPPELESVSTPVPGRTFTHRVCMLFNEALEFPNEAAQATDPRGASEPRVAAWFASALGEMDAIGVGFDFWEEETDPLILERVNVNTATLEELEPLPVIETVLAERIIEERSSERGPFKGIGDLRRVSGIGEASIVELRPLITTGFVERVNVNFAPHNELEALPAISDQLATNIIEEREIQPFDRIDDLKRVSGISDAKVAELRSLVTAARTNVNTATKADLEALPYLGTVLSQRIIEEREISPFSGIDDLTRVEGIDEAMVAELRLLLTTDIGILSLGELGLTAADFLYVAQAPPEGAETELEQQIGQLVREEFSLSASQRIEVHANRRGRFEYRLDDAAELARQALSLLATGRPMSPDTMCHPGDIRDEGYFDLDVEQLITRVETAKGWVSNLRSEFESVVVLSTVQMRFDGDDGTQIQAGALVTHNPTGTTWAIDQDVTIGASGTVDATATTSPGGPPIKVGATTDWSIETVVAGWNSLQSLADSILDLPNIVVELLLKAAKFGIQGAVPLGLDDPDLATRYDIVLAELTRRSDRCDRLVEEAERAEKPNVKVRRLIAAMKALFGESYVVLPTFVPHQADNLRQALEQDVLNGLGEDRLRLWMQQVGEVRQPLLELEDTLMLAEGWSQSMRRGVDPILSLELAQLPFTDGRNWLGLSVEEGAEAEPAPGWAHSPLSVIAVSSGPLPVFANDTGDEHRIVTAGLLLDAWSELIPSRRVNTSVAFQYDAPTTQAPQSLLLAVPSQVKKVARLWTPQALAAIVNDTIDLAKVRAVDIDALAPDPLQPLGSQPAPVGGILPGIYLPTDPDRPGWARDVASMSLEEWLQSFVKLDAQVFMAPYTVFEGWIARHEPTGIIFRSLVSGELLDGSYFTDPAWGGDAGTVLLSDNGIQIELAQTAPRVHVVVGWLDPAEQEVRMRSADGAELEGEIREEALGLSEVHSTGGGAAVDYHVHRYEFIAPEIKYLEILGRCLLNSVTTFKLE